MQVFDSFNYIEMAADGMGGGGESVFKLSMLNVKYKGIRCPKCS